MRCVTCSASTNSTAADSSRGTLRVSKATSGASTGIGRFAIEQVGVGAVVDERGDSLGEGAQDRCDVLGAGVGLVLGASAQLVAQQSLARDEPLAGGAGVDGADRDLQQVALQRVQAVGVLPRAVIADEQGVQRDEVGDLLDRRVGGIVDVPGVDGVLVLDAPIVRCWAPGTRRQRNS